MLSETAPTDAGKPFIDLISVATPRCLVAEMEDDEKKAKAQSHFWQFDGDGLLRLKGRIWVPMNLRCA